MKLSKQMAVLNGITGIRVKLNFSQLRFAQYLGVSKSLISMVENGHRSLPLDALTRLSQLEADVAGLLEGKNLNSIPENGSHQLAAFEQKIEWKKADTRLHIRQLRYRLEKMKNREAQISLSLQLVQGLVGLPAATVHPQALPALEIQRFDLCKKLKSCHPFLIKNLEAKIAMLEISLATETIDIKKNYSASLRAVEAAGSPCKMIIGLHLLRTIAS